MPNISGLQEIYNYTIIQPEQSVYLGNPKKLCKKVQLVSTPNYRVIWGMLWMSWIDPLLLTSVRTSSPVMEPKGTEDDDGKDDQQHKEQGRPVSDDHNWRIRSVDTLPENYHS